MTYVKDGKLILEEEPPAKCDYCGKIDELRPYGRDGAFICFECGMKNIEETKRQFNALLAQVE